MGYPLSTLRQLAGLCSDEPFIRKTFDHYKAVAVVIHGLGSESFKQTVRSNFELLHRTTGQDFAFISFIDPPQEWKSRHGDWMKDSERLAAGDGCEDDDFFRALKGRLDLPDTPCLILTDNMLSADFLILYTSSGKVISQMEAIGEYLQTCEGRFPICGVEFLSFAATLGAVHRQCTSDGKSLADNIAALLAVRSLGGQGTVNDRIARQDQCDLAINLVRREFRLLRDERNRTEGQDRDLAQIALDRMSEYLGLVATQEQCRTVSDFPDENEITKSADSFMVSKDMYMDMEPLSQSFIKYYTRLLPFYFKPASYFKEYNHIHTFLLQDVLDDFAPLGNYLGKAIEEEINASVVQLIRRTLGVNMPDYYRLFEENLESDCTVPTKEKPIRFNLKGRKLNESSWQDRTIPLGDSVYAIQRIIGQGSMRYCFGVFGDRFYLDNVLNFARCRNEACHNGLFSLESFQRMYSLFDSLMSGYIKDMVHLKHILSGSK